MEEVHLLQMELSETGIMDVDGLSQSQQVEKGKTEKYTDNLNEYKCFSSRFLRHQISQKINQGCVTKSRSQKMFACVLFADISGFTQLSSRLCAEELKRHINEYFSLLLHVIYSNHGDVIKFCGDAVLIMWPVPTNGTEEMKSAAVLMASLCALQLMEECGQYKSGAPVTSKQNMSGHYSNKFGAGRTTASTNESSYTVAVTRRSMSAAISGQQSASSTLSPSDNSKPVELSLHSGIACGMVSTMILGDGNRHEFILAGDVLQEMGEAEGKAKVGEIGVHRDAYERIKTKLDATPVNDAGPIDPTKTGEVQPTVYILTGRLKENLSQQHQHQQYQPLSPAATVLSPHASSRIDESNRDSPTSGGADSGPHDMPVLVPPTSGATECSNEQSDKSSVTHNLSSPLSAIQPLDVVRTTSAKQSSHKSSVSSELSGHSSHDSSSSTLKQSFCLPPQRKSFNGSQELWTFFENKLEISAETESSNVMNNKACSSAPMTSDGSTPPMDSAKDHYTLTENTPLPLPQSVGGNNVVDSEMVLCPTKKHPASSPYRLSFSLFSGANDGQHQRRRGFVATYATLSTGASLPHRGSVKPAFQELTSGPNVSSRVTSFYFPIREDCVIDCGDENGSASFCQQTQQTVSRKGGGRRYRQSSFFSALSSARKGVARQVRRTLSSFVDTRTVADDSDDDDGDQGECGNGGGADRNASETDRDGGMLNDNILHALAYTDGLGGSPGRLSRSTSGSSSPNRKPTVIQLKLKLHFNSDKVVRAVRKYILSGVYVEAMELVAIPPTAVVSSDGAADSKTTSCDVHEGLSPCTATDHTCPPPTVVNSSVNSALLAVELRKFVHETALRAIETHTSALLSEMRDITTLFIQILGLEEDFRVGSHVKPQRVLCIILSVMQRFSGSLRQFVVDDKGCVCIVCFGLFGSSCENNGAQAVDFALTLRSALHSVGVKTAIGITTGKVYCGLVGAGHRCEFAVMGASVNLAARLMCACVTLPAAKGVLVDSAVHTAAQTGFVFAQLTSITAKGYAEPVVVFSPKQKAKKSKNPPESTPIGVANGSIKAGVVSISTKSAVRSSALPPLTHQCSGRYSSSASSKGRKKAARRAHTVSDAKWFAEHRAAVLEDPLINDSSAAYVPADVGFDVGFCDRASEMNVATEALFHNLFGWGSSGTAPARSLLIYGPSGVGLTTFLLHLRNKMRAESAKNAAKIELISVRCLQCNQYMSYNVIAAILSRLMGIAVESSLHSSESNSVVVSGDNDGHSKASDSLCNRAGKHSLVKPKLAFKSHTNKASAHLTSGAGRRRMSCASGERTTTGSSLTGIIEHSNEGGGRRSSCVNLDRRLSTAHSVSSVDAVTELDASSLSMMDQKVYVWCKRMIPESLTLQQALEFSKESVNPQMSLPRSIKTAKLINCLAVLNDALKCAFPCVDIALYEILSKSEQHAELCDALVRVMLEVLLSLALGERIGSNPTKPPSDVNEITVLVILDDLQWCDVESLAVYTNICNRLYSSADETHTSHSKGKGCLVAACNSDDGRISHVAANDSGTMVRHDKIPKLGSTENSQRALSQRSLIVNAKVSELAEASLCVSLPKLSQSSVSQIVVSKLGSRKWGWLINNYHLTVSGGAPSDSRRSPKDATARRKSLLGRQTPTVITFDGDLLPPPSTDPFEPTMPASRNSRRVSHRSSSFNTIQSMVTETPTDSSMVKRQMHGKTASQKLFTQPHTQNRRPSIVMRQEKSREESVIDLIYSLTQHGLPALLHDLISSLNFALDNNRFNGLHQLPVVKQRNKMVLEVVDNLGGVELAVLKAASVVSGAFTSPLVSAILVSMGLEMCAETELLENTLGNLVKDGLISMKQTSEVAPPFLITSAPTVNYYIFTAESTQSAIYSLMLDSQRVVAHTAVASHLEQSLSECGAVPNADQLATITTHYLLGDNIGKKIEFLKLSSEQAQRVNDVSEALGCLSELVYLCTGLHKEELLQKCREQEIASLQFITINFVPATEEEQSECDTESSSGVPIKGRLSLALGLTNPFRNENHGAETLTNDGKLSRKPLEWLFSCIKRQSSSLPSDDRAAAQLTSKPPSTYHSGVSPVWGQWSSSFRFAATSMKVACGSEKYHAEGVEDTDSEWVLAGFVDRDNSGENIASAEGGGEADESSESDTSTDHTTESSGGETQHSQPAEDDSMPFSTLFKRRRMLCNTHTVIADMYCVPYKPHRRQTKKGIRGTHTNIKSTGDCADGCSDGGNTDDSSDSSSGSSGRTDQGLPTLTDHSAAVSSVQEDKDRDPRVDRSIRLLQSVMAVKVGLDNIAEWVGSVSMLHYRSGNITEFIEYSALSLYLMELHNEQVTSPRLLTTSTKTEATPKSRILQSLRTFSSKRGFQYRHRTSISSATISGRLFTINSSKSARSVGQAWDSIAMMRGGNMDHNNRHCLKLSITGCGSMLRTCLMPLGVVRGMFSKRSRRRVAVDTTPVVVEVASSVLSPPDATTTTKTLKTKTVSLLQQVKERFALHAFLCGEPNIAQLLLNELIVEYTQHDVTDIKPSSVLPVTSTASAAAYDAATEGVFCGGGAVRISGMARAKMLLSVVQHSLSTEPVPLTQPAFDVMTDPHSQAIWHMCDAHYAANEGRFTAAVENLREAMTQFRALRDDTSYHFICVQTGWLLVVAGRVEEARAMVHDVQTFIAHTRETCPDDDNSWSGLAISVSPLELLCDACANGDLFDPHIVQLDTLVLHRQAYDTAPILCSNVASPDMSDVKSRRNTAVATNADGAEVEEHTYDSNDRVSQTIRLFAQATVNCDYQQQQRKDKQFCSSSVVDQLCAQLVMYIGYHPVRHPKTAVDKVIKQQISTVVLASKRKDFLLHSLTVTDVHRLVGNNQNDGSNNSNHGLEFVVTTFNKALLFYMTLHTVMCALFAHNTHCKEWPDNVTNHGADCGTGIGPHMVCELLVLTAYGLERFYTLTQNQFPGFHWLCVSLNSQFDLITARLSSEYTQLAQILAKEI